MSDIGGKAVGLGNDRFGVLMAFATVGNVSGALAGSNVSVAVRALLRFADASGARVSGVLIGAGVAGLARSFRRVACANSGRVSGARSTAGSPGADLAMAVFSAVLAVLVPADESLFSKTMLTVPISTGTGGISVAWISRMAPIRPCRPTERMAGRCWWKNASERART